MKIVSTYVPHDRQIEAHCAPEQFIGYGGSMGGGKTRWLCEMSKQLLLDYPGNFGVICRASGPALKLSTMEVFFSETLIQGSEEWKALGATYNKTEGLLTLENIKDSSGVASKVWFTGLDSGNLERLKSLNLGFFAIEEATEVAESIFMMLMTRLRRANVPKIARKGIITANPEAGWIKRRFVDQKLPNHTFIYAGYKDNPYIPEDYEDLFETMPERWVSKYLHGSWEAASGLIFKEFDPSFHVIENPPPRWWKPIRGLDHGQVNPAACIGMRAGVCDRYELEGIIGDRVDGVHKAFDHYPILIVHSLYYSPGLVSEHRKGIAATFSEEYRDQQVTTWADPSIWRNDREKLVVGATGKSRLLEWSIADEYLEPPFPLKGLRRGNNSVLAGIDRISMLLKIGHLFFYEDPSLQPLIGAAGEIRNYSWKEQPREDENWPEKPSKRDDHACDALRYAVMSLPSPKTKETPVNPHSFQEVMKEAREWAKERRRFAFDTDTRGRVVWNS